mmetsp:Transcript_54068/g.160333  ORF Transcript_54068/g.160333 Transcript_54068/m.160333 type:complete len:352 (-) Transcript_54068:33-1088(-)
MKDAQEAATDVVEFDPQKLTLPSYVALRPTHDQDKFKAERLDSLRAALKRQVRELELTVHREATKQPREHAATDELIDEARALVATLFEPSVLRTDAEKALRDAIKELQKELGVQAHATYPSLEYEVDKLKALLQEADDETRDERRPDAQLLQQAHALIASSAAPLDKQKARQFEVSLTAAVDAIERHLDDRHDRYDHSHVRFAFDRLTSVLHDCRNEPNAARHPPAALLARAEALVTKWRPTYNAQQRTERVSTLRATMESVEAAVARGSGGMLSFYVEKLEDMLSDLADVDDAVRPPAALLEQARDTLQKAVDKIAERDTAPPAAAAAAEASEEEDDDDDEYDEYDGML